MKAKKHFLFFVLMIFVGCSSNYSEEVLDMANHSEEVLDMADQSEEILESRLPSLYITLPEEQLDSILRNKNYKTSAYVVLVSSDGDTLFCDYITHIKSRGNYTFKLADKKSFSIKLRSRRQLLGLKNGKRFALLANAFDKSYIRNAIALDLASEIGLPAPRYEFISLYINSEYRGLYQMTNKVEECMDFNRIEGFLIEKNGLSLDNPIEIVLPKHISEQENDSMTKLYKEKMAYLSNSSETDEYIDEWIQNNIDISSFARYYLLQEITHNMDAGVNSFFMYGIDETAKLIAGPAWDFDFSLRPTYYEWSQSEWSNNEIIANSKIDSDGVEYPYLILYYLCKNERFRDTVEYIYKNEISNCCHKYLESVKIDSLVSLLQIEVARDYEKNFPSSDGDYMLVTQRVRMFLKQRIDFLDWYFDTKPNERICVTFRDGWWEEKWPRTIQIWLPANNPIFIPKPLSEVPYNNSPIYQLYYAGTDSIVPEGTIIKSNETLELRWRYPTWREVQSHRIKKKLKKLFG